MRFVHTAILIYDDKRQNLRLKIIIVVEVKSLIFGIVLQSCLVACLFLVNVGYNVVIIL